jgi:YD repeat-containing protein
MHTPTFHSSRFGIMLTAGLPHPFMARRSLSGKISRGLPKAFAFFLFLGLFASLRATGVEAPLFEPSGGPFPTGTALEVVLTCETAGAAIYYTLNGDDPNGSSTSYSAPVSVSGDVTIRAVAILSGQSSEVVEAQYRFTDTLARASVAYGHPWENIEGMAFPRRIRHGNIKRIELDYGDGFTEVTENTFYTDDPTLTGRLKATFKGAFSRGVQTEQSPAVAYTYVTGTTLVEKQRTLVQGPALPNGFTRSNLEDAADLINQPHGELETTVEHFYNARGQLEKTTLRGHDQEVLHNIGGPYVTMEVTAWDPTGRFPQTVVNEYGHWTKTEYDPFGRPTRVEDIRGQETETVYDALGRVVESRDLLRGLTTTTEIKVASGSGSVTGIQTVNKPPSLSDASNLLLSSRYFSRTVSSGAPPVTTHFDRTGRVIRTIREGYGGQISYADTIYNLDGQVVAVSDPFPHHYAGFPDDVEVNWTYTTYDHLGRVKTVKAPTGTITTHVYAGRARQSRVSGNVPGGEQVTTSLVSVKGETIKVWNADNEPPSLDVKGENMVRPSIEFILDGFGRMTETKTWQGQPGDRPVGWPEYISIFASYDALGNQKQLIDPDKGTWDYVYDALGRLVLQSDANGSKVHTRYDRLNRPLWRRTWKSDESVPNPYINEYDANPSAIALPGEMVRWFYYDKPENAGRDHVVVDEAHGWVGALQR